MALAVVVLVASEDSRPDGDARSNDEQDSTTKEPEDDVIILERAGSTSMNNRNTIRVLQLADGTRAMQFGELDYQASTKHWNVKNDSDFSDVDECIRTGLIGLAFSNPVIQYASHLLTERGDEEACLEYTQRFNVLLVGLGGGNMVRLIRGRVPFANITVIELEGAVIKLARKYFNIVEDNRFRIVHADANRFVDEQLQKLGDAVGVYDFIYHDAADENGLVKPLRTREFFAKLKRLLVPQEGVLVTNAVTIGSSQNDGDDDDGPGTIGFLKEVTAALDDTFGSSDSSLHLCLLQGQTLIVSGETIPLFNSEPKKFVVDHVKQVFKGIDPVEDDWYWNVFSTTLADRSEGEIWVEKCSMGVPSVSTIADKSLDISMTNTLDRPIIVYWDKRPRRDFSSREECVTKLPLERHLLRSLVFQASFQPGETLVSEFLLTITSAKLTFSVCPKRFTSYPHDWFVAVVNENDSVDNGPMRTVDCFQVPAGSDPSRVVTWRITDVIR